MRYQAALRSDTKILRLKILGARNIGWCPRAGKPRKALFFPLISRSGRYEPVTMTAPVPLTVWVPTTEPSGLVIVMVTELDPFLALTVQEMKVP